MRFISRCGNDKFSNGGHDLQNDTAKRINLCKAFVLWRVEVNCRWCCGKDLLCASVIAMWLVLSRGCDDCSVLFVLMFLILFFSMFSVVSGLAH